MKRTTVLLAAFIILLVSAADASAATRKRSQGSTRAKAASQTAGKSGARRSEDVEYLKNVSATRSLPFSEAVRVGNMLYLAGQVGTDASGAIVAGGVEAETRQTLENIRAVLERHGSSLRRVVKCTVMLVDLPANYAPMNSVYRTFFAAERMPARSTFGASALALGAKVEIECWATVGR